MKKKDREVYIQKGREVFIHTKSPMTMEDAAKLGLRLIDIPTWKLGIRKVRRKKR